MASPARFLVLVGLSLAGCTTSGAPAAEVLPDAAVVAASFRPGLQYDGSVAFTRTKIGGAKALPAGAVVEHVEISAPILPDVLVLYAAEGAQFPASLAAEETLVDAAALTFDQLLIECAGYPAYSGIVIAAPSDPPLTQAQLTTNYELVAQCAYVHHTAKPYWIPRLVADVDVCGRVLGADWRLLAAGDLAALTTADFQFLADALAAAGTSAGLGAMYFSLRTYALDTNGALAQAHLEPNATVRVEPLPVSASFTSHLEGDFGLRCIRAVP